MCYGLMEIFECFCFSLCKTTLLTPETSHLTIGWLEVMCSRGESVKFSTRSGIKWYGEARRGKQNWMVGGVDAHHRWNSCTYYAVTCLSSITPRAPRTWQDSFSLVLSDPRYNFALAYFFLHFSFFFELTVMIADRERTTKKEDQTWSRDDKRIMDQRLLYTKRPCHATPLTFHFCATFFPPSSAVVDDK